MWVEITDPDTGNDEVVRCEHDRKCSSCPILICSGDDYGASEAEEHMPYYIGMREQNA